MADVRASCGDVETNLQCDDCALRCVHDLEVTEGDTLSFVVAGLPTTGSRDGTGQFELSFAFSPDTAIGDACVPESGGGRACPEAVVLDREEATVTTSPSYTLDVVVRPTE